MQTLKRASLYIFYGLLAYIPFHIFLSTWLGTSFGLLEFTKIFKDIFMLIGATLAFIPSVTKPWFKQLLKDRLVQLILAYATLTVLLAFVRPTDPDAEVLGLVYNTRFLLFFLYAVLLTRLFDVKHLQRRAIQIVVVSGVVVLLFGILQYTVLSSSALTHVGYSRENGVLPAFFIDDKPDLERVMSTLRDPNSLGSYILIISGLALAALRKLKNPDVKRAAKGVLAISVLCLWFTFSRSAWLGFALTVGVIAGVCLYSKKRITLKKSHVSIAVVALLLSGAGLYAVRDSYFMQNVVFHADDSTVLEDPNQLRVRFWQESVQDISSNPVGGGPGTAGLASIKNNVQGTVLNENYYLQLATEVGVVGLALFVAIVAVCAYRLWGLRKSTIAVGLLASLVGLTFTNVLVHIWSNEAVAYTWWGLAGLVVVVGPSKLRNTRRA